MRTTFFLAALPILAFAAPSKPADIPDVDDEDCSSSTTKAAVTTKAPRPPKWKTSTVYATQVHTVTSCAPTVTNCPGRPGKPVVVTEVIAVSTTVCPDDDDDVITKPTAVPTKDSCSTTISTSTCVHTETTGPKDVVVTTYLPVTQTICPVVPGKPTWAHPEPSVPAGGPGKPTWPEETPKPVVPGGGPKPTGTGSWPAPTKSGQAVVTAGAAENMAALKMVGAAAFAALLL